MRTSVIIFFIFTSIFKINGQSCDVDLTFLGYDCESMAWLYRFDISGPGDDYQINGTLELPLITIGANYMNVNNGDTLFVSFGEVNNVSFRTDPFRLIVSKDYADTDISFVTTTLTNEDCVSNFFKRTIINITPKPEPIEIGALLSCEIGPGIAEYDLFRASLDILGEQDGLVVFAEDSLFEKRLVFDFHISQDTTIFAAIFDGQCLSSFIEIPLRLLDSNEDVIFNMLNEGNVVSGICDTVGQGVNLTYEFLFDDTSSIYTASVFALVGGIVSSFELTSEQGRIEFDLFVDAPGMLRVTELIKRGNGCVDLSMFYNELEIKYNHIPVYDVPDLIESCVSYALGGVAGENVGNEATFYTESMGQGAKFSFGDVIDHSTTLYVFDENNACIVEDTLQLIIEQFSNGDLDTLLELCESYDGFINLREVIDSDMTGSWIFENGAEVNNPDSFDVVGLNVGIIKLDYISEANICPSDTTQIELNIIKQLSAGLDTVKLFCEPEPSIDLTAYLSNHDLGGRWELSDNGAGMSVDPIQGIATMGLFDYRYIIDGGVYCNSDTSEVNIKFVPPYLGNIDIEICSSEEVPDLDELINENGAKFFNQQSNEIVDWQKEVVNYPPGLHELLFWQPFPNGCNVDTNFASLNIIEYTDLPFEVFFPECLSSEEVVVEFVGEEKEAFTFILDGSESPVEDEFIVTNQTTSFMISGECYGDTTITLNWVDEPEVTIVEVDIPQGKQLNLSSSAPISSIEWQGEDLSCMLCDKAVLSNSGFITAIFNYDENCMGTVQGQFEVITNIDLYYPSIISGNPSIAANNTFYINVENPNEIQNAELLIFDRYGNKIFENSNYTFNEIASGWNGKLNNRKIEVGVYVFALKYSFNGKELVERGTITFIN